MPTIAFGAIAPQDAFAAFTARKRLKPTFRWQDVWQAEHARGFAVAGVMRLDILGLIRTELEAALANGASANDFRNSLRAKLVAKGWWGNIEVTDPASGELRTTKFNNQRLDLIFDVNMRQSHAAGRWARGMRGRMPLVVYRTMGDERVRQSHRPWDYLVLPREHPFWDTHIPPNGWRCRCHFYFTNQAGVDALIAAGHKVRTTAPEVQYVEFRNTATGQVERVPRGIDPGFAYNPGKAHVQHAVALLDDGLATLQRLRAANEAKLEKATSAPAGEGHALARAAIAKGRSEPAFKSFLEVPPVPRAAEPPIGLPVAAVPAIAGGQAGAQLPVVASVSATDLLAAQRMAALPPDLPTTPAAWALAQTVVDRGQRLVLNDAGTLVLYYWAHAGRVDALLLQRGALVWWAQALVRLSVEEAVARWPRLASVLQPGAAAA